MVDGVVMTHKTWAECEARVKGKKATRFKKSLDAANEKEIIKEFGGWVNLNIRKPALASAGFVV